MSVVVFLSLAIYELIGNALLHVGNCLVMPPKERPAKRIRRLPKAAAPVAEMKAKEETRGSRCAQSLFNDTIVGQFVHASLTYYCNSDGKLDDSIVTNDGLATATLNVHEAITLWRSFKITGISRTGEPYREPRGTRYHHFARQQIQRLPLESDRCHTPLTSFVREWRALSEEEVHESTMSATPVLGTMTTKGVIDFLHEAFPPQMTIAPEATESNSNRSRDSGVRIQKQPVLPPDHFWLDSNLALADKNAYTVHFGEQLMLTDLTWDFHCQFKNQRTTLFNNMVRCPICRQEGRRTATDTEEDKRIKRDAALCTHGQWRPSESPHWIVDHIYDTFADPDGIRSLKIIFVGMQRNVHSLFGVAGLVSIMTDFLALPADRILARSPLPRFLSAPIAVPAL